MTQKSEIKHWSNARGEGKLFSCTFMDETVRPLARRQLAQPTARRLELD